MEYMTLFNLYMKRANETKDPESRKCFKKLANKVALDARVKAYETSDSKLLEMSDEMLEFC